MNFDIILMNWKKLERFQESVLLKSNQNSKVYTVVGFIIFAFLLIFIIDIASSIPYYMTQIVPL